jgi:hypothetical protein
MKYFMRTYSIILITVLFIFSCNFKKKKENEVQIVFNDGLYEVRNVESNKLQEDSVKFYLDSNLNILKRLITTVKLNGVQHTNQIINYDESGKVDSSRSIFYSIEKSDSYLNIRYYSKYKDSVCLVIGDFDSNYINFNKLDTFYLKQESIKIPYKGYYQRGKLGIYKKDGSKYKGFELYIPSRLIDS